MSCVQVWCRIKPQGPPTGAWSGSAGECAVSSDDSTSTLMVEVSAVGHQQPAYKLPFQLDFVFGPLTTQEEVFEQLRPRVQEFLQGYSATVLTYGQTGSGKTYTIQGAEAVDKEGIVPRVAGMIFSHCDEHKSRIAVDVYVSFLEIYQEKLRDLLQNSSTPSSLLVSSRGLRIRETAKNGIWVEGLTEKHVSSTLEFAELFSSASLKRCVGSHAMNAESSRSHLCCTISIMKKPDAGISGGAGVLSSKFHLVDLAGSEMVRKTDASGQRLSEAKHINKSLSALGNVIGALTSGSNPLTMLTSSVDPSTVTPVGTGSGIPPAKRHIPYRDSKLTRILQDSLAGNSKTTLILTVSSSKCSVQETLATLRFGERARKLTTKPRINVISGHDHRGSSLSSPADGGGLSSEVARLRVSLLEAQQEIMRLSELLADTNKPTTVVGANRLDLNDGFRIKATTGSSVAMRTSSSSTSSSSKCQHCGDISKDTTPNQAVESDSVRYNDSLLAVDDVVRMWDGNDNISENNPGQSRCAVCCLTEGEGNLLDENLFLAGANTATSDSPLIQSNGINSLEGMGILFTCDGNCGNYFHPRCVGISAAQKGEWFCIDCSAIMQVESAGGSGIGEFLAPPTHMLSRVTRQYHVMRLERNRLMLNWQQERKMFQMKAAKDMLAQERRDQEHEVAEERCSQLEKLLHREELEISRLKKSRDHEFNLRVMMEKECTATTRGPFLGELDLVSALGMPSKLVSKSDKSPSGSPTVLLGPSSQKSISVSDVLGSIVDQNSPSDFHGNTACSDIPKPWLVNKRASSRRTPSQVSNSPTSRSPDMDSRQHALVRSTLVEDDRRRVQVSPIRPSPLYCGEDISVCPYEEGSSDSLEETAKAYLFPIRNRLKDLLKSVELEAGSFSQIRTKQKERETLRSSHISRRGGGVVKVVNSSPDHVGDVGPPLTTEIITSSSGNEIDANKKIFRNFVPSRRKYNFERNVTEHPDNDNDRSERNLMSTTFPSISKMK